MNVKQMYNIQTGKPPHSVCSLRSGVSFCFFKKHLKIDPLHPQRIMPFQMLQTKFSSYFWNRSYSSFVDRLHWI